MQVWRICKARFAVSAFTGEGARLYQGRWNPSGVRMVYTSSSLALASLEFFVHLDPTVAPDDLVSTSATLPPEKVSIKRVSPKDLPTNWRTLNNPALQTIGADWIASQSSVALEVPSIVVEDEWNVLLNPAHPDFSKIVKAIPKPFHFDQRLFKATR